MKIAIFGDSITAGWVENRVSFVLKEKLVKQLEKMNLKKVQVSLFGVPGDDCLLGMKRIDEVEKSHADLIFVFFGANDASKHRNVSEEIFQDTLLEMALKLGNEKTIFLTPPYYDEVAGDEKRSNERVEKYRIRTFLAAQQAESEVIDLYKQMTNYSAPEEFLQDDGLHFSEEGYDLLAGMIAAKVRERVLKKMKRSKV
ncbi:Lysophospholipase L1 [Pilibacter termitis]|uniref:Lysophospholipase L1 n=1 Tax=Pilibacter termitis TaxID=263852 RepID=A0A1T4MI15_9ENTE|nr:GDSL-type esterase/lipase family protein [Pilibacter termitis]SJZ66730.1 Lysophospholipase L1 [Pilibacter termitis]